MINIIQVQNYGTNLLCQRHFKYSYLLGVYSFVGLILSFLIYIYFNFGYFIFYKLIKKFNYNYFILLLIFCIKFSIFSFFKICYNSY